MPCWYTGKRSNNVLWGTLVRLDSTLRMRLDLPRQSPAAPSVPPEEECILLQVDVSRVASGIFVLFVCLYFCNVVYSSDRHSDIPAFLRITYIV